MAIYLNYMRSDFYEKGTDTLWVHLYVKNVSKHAVEFQREQIIVKFTTSNDQFLKIHGNGAEKEATFQYAFMTRGELDPDGSSSSVKAPFIELKIKKTIAGKWGGIEKLNFPTTPKKVDDSITANVKSSLDSKEKTPVREEKSPSPRQNGSPQKSPQLLGGKSTPLEVRKRPEAEKASDNQPSSSVAEVKRNVQKASAVVQLDQSVGLTGLENFANNCYMNVVIQVLANIVELRDYFKNDQFINDIVINNPLSSSGKVVKAFAELIKALWLSGKKAFKPTALKNIMGRQCSLFLGLQQHDAQEFCASLLDNLHEDLNHGQLPDKSSVEAKVDPEAPTANEKPDTAWASHTKRNSSMLVNLFHGQLVSKVTCAACHKTSYSYDPCNQISIPIPAVKRELNVILFTRDTDSIPLKIPLQISTPNSQVWHLLHSLQTHIDIPAHLLTVFRGVSDVCNDDQLPLSTVCSHKYVVVSEVTSKDESEYFSVPVFQYLANPPDFVFCTGCRLSQNELRTKLKRCTRCLCAAYCTRECQTKDWTTHSKACVKGAKVPVGLPFHITIPKEGLTLDTLESIICERASYSVEIRTQIKGQIDSDSNKTNENSEKATENFSGSSESVDRKESCENLSNMTAKELLHCTVVLKLTSSAQKSSPEDPVILSADNCSFEKLTKATGIILEWQNSDSADGSDKSVKVVSREEPICEQLFEDKYMRDKKEDQCTLHDCLKLFMEPERLDESESWKCPKCKNLQSAKKELAVSYPPCILMLHMKRFTFGDYGQKINKPVSYPLSDFDFTPYVAKETRSKIDYPLTYDLCGVISHIGTMRMGHYTCMVRLVNGKDEEEIGWRHFDDVDVTKIKEEKVVSPDAYVLVYRLRGTHDLMKTDRHLSLVPTVTAPSASPVNTPKVKRKRPESAYVAERQAANERKSHSDHLMNRMKRSISTESPIADTTTLNPDQSWMPLRRSHSAASSYRPRRNQKKDTEYKRTEMKHSVSSECVNHAGDEQTDLPYFTASSSSLNSDSDERDFADDTLLKPDFIACKDHLSNDKRRRYSSPNSLEGACASIGAASVGDECVGDHIFETADRFPSAYDSFERLDLSEAWTKTENATKQHLSWQNNENDGHDFLENTNAKFSDTFADLAVSESCKLSNVIECSSNEFRADSLDSLDLSSPLYREPADINENDLD